jgi:hypothetical protein
MTTVLCLSTRFSQTLNFKGVGITLTDIDAV